MKRLIQRLIKKGVDSNQLRSTAISCFFAMVFLLSLTSVHGAPGEKGQNPDQDKLYIAVLQFDAENVTESEASILRGKVESDLTRASGVSVLERREMERILQEQGFQQSGACDTTGCQVELGRILSVDRMVFGVVGRLGDDYVLNLKMVDVETGHIVVSESSGPQDEISDLYVKSIPEMLPKLFIPDESPADIQSLVQTDNPSVKKSKLVSVGRELKSVLTSTRSGVVEDQSLEEIIIASRGKSERAAFWWSVGTFGLGGGNLYAADYPWFAIHFLAASASSGVAQGAPAVGGALFLSNWVWSIYTSKNSVHKYNQNLVKQKIQADIRWIQQRPVPVLVMSF